MPSSKSSLDKRDVYYRKGKSDGYRARSAYKLLHLDEEFDLFRGVQTAVDLCAAPGSWSQVLSQRLKPGQSSSSSRVVSVDLQPMAPLPGITTMQVDITVPETVPHVLEALGGRKADLVVCDGAPDVTGVHDLDAYLHSQLLLAALTLSLTLMAPGATLIFKIFLSPLDPSAALLRSQLRAFFPGPQGPQRGEGAQPPAVTAFAADFADVQEFDDTRTDFEQPADDAVDASIPAPAPSAEAARSTWGSGYDGFGRPGGVWVRKPRSSRKGSGEAFIVCRNFDPSTLPLQLTPESLAGLRKQIGNTLTLESLGQIGSEPSTVNGSGSGSGSGSVSRSGSGDSWTATKGFVGTGDLGAGASRTPSQVPIRSNSLTVSTHGRYGSFASMNDEPSPVSAETLFPEIANHSINRTPTLVASSSRFRSGSSTSDATMPSLHEGSSTREFTTLSTSPKTSLYAQAFGTPGFGSSLTAREREIMASTPMGDGTVSPALSASSKTDAFFSTSLRDSMPTPPPPPASNASANGGGGTGAGTGALLGRGGSLGRGMPPVSRARVVTTPVPPTDSPMAAFPTPPLPNPTPLRSVTGPVPKDLAPSGISSSRPSSSGRLLSPTAVHRHLPGNFTREERHHAEESEVPLHAGDILDPVPDDESLAIRSSENPGRWRLIGELGEGAFASVWSAESKEHADEGVVAVKLVGRTMAARSRRTAISFYREVEVLRHLVHPGVVGYIAHFSTATHHALVLERLAGGELFSLLAEQANSDRMIRRSATDSDGYGFIRRVFGELSRAVAWLHEVEVVHRDIKLENILFTVNPFSLPATESGGIPLDRLPVPLVKLSDFGLSRFIRSSSPLLSTRCGSEAYAAPEVVMGNLYDGRKTDAWALGVVLYALIAGELPFEDGAPLPPGRARAGSNASVGGDTPRETRRRTMHRIAKGEYGWRDGVGSPAARAVVARLLTRDPVRRARVPQLWDDGWMRSGPGAVPPPNEAMPLHPAEVAAGPAAGTSGVPPDAGAGSAQVKAALPVPPPLLRRASDTPHVVVAGGVLVDHEHIDEVARLDMSAAE